MASITVEMAAGDDVKSTLIEAMRIAKLLGVNVKYNFNDTQVCVSSLGELLFALDKTNNPALFFYETLNTIKLEANAKLSGSVLTSGTILNNPTLAH